MKINQNNLFLRKVFDVCIEFLESGKLSEDDIIDNMFMVIDMFADNGDEKTVRAFTIAKMKRDGLL